MVVHRSGWFNGREKFVPPLGVEAGKSRRGHSNFSPAPSPRLSDFAHVDGETTRCRGGNGGFGGIRMSWHAGDRVLRFHRWPTDIVIVATSVSEWATLHSLTLVATIGSAASSHLPRCS